MEWVFLGLIVLIIGWLLMSYNGVVAMNQRPTRPLQISMCSSSSGMISFPISWKP